MLTFDDFNASRRSITAGEAEVRFGITTGYYEDPNQPIYIYEGDCYISESVHEGRNVYDVQIERDEVRFPTSLGAARHLYLYWYIGEIARPRTMHEAASVFRTFLDHYAYAKASPHAILRQLQKQPLTRETAVQIEFLDWYIEHVTGMALEDVA